MNNSLPKYLSIKFYEPERDWEAKIENFLRRYQWRYGGLEIEVLRKSCYVKIFWFCNYDGLKFLKWKKPQKNNLGKM